MRQHCYHTKGAADSLPHLWYGRGYNASIARKVADAPQVDVSMRWNAPEPTVHL
jgi:hypothetical protein